MDILENKLINQESQKFIEISNKGKFVDNFCYSNRILSRITSLNNSLYKLSNLSQSYSYLNISIASPYQIKKWAEKYLSNYGEVFSVLNMYDKLNESSFFSQRIFGPLKDWSCKCLTYQLKYRKFNIKIKPGIICPACNVEVTSSRVRRYNMGYIELFFPVAHTWYLNNIPNYLALFLKFAYSTQYTTDSLGRKKHLLIRFINQHTIHSVVYLREFPFMFTLINKLFSEYLNIPFRTVGSELIKDVLEQIDLNYLISKLRQKIFKFFEEKKIPSKLIIFQLRVLESFLATKTRPEWMILTRIPVLPPSLRPFFEIESGHILLSPLNTFYNQILINNKDYLKKSYQLYTKFSAIRALQISVDALFDNNRLPEQEQLLVNDRPLTSLTEGLKGKYGRFRYNLLGKRVNFSARSVIVVGPTLSLYQCGIPYEIALKLFEPHISKILTLKYLKLLEIHSALNWSKYLIKSYSAFWFLLKSILLDYPLILNRAPTLHRFGIQSFNPILILGKAITLHPLVCTGFNADFDGDQMAVHMPLYQGSQIEAYTCMSPSNNLLTPANGDVILKPSQDIVIGSCYLSLLIFKNRNICFKYFMTEIEVINCYLQKQIDLHTPILIKMDTKCISFIKQNNQLKLKSNSIINEILNIEIYKYISTLEYIYILTNLGIIIAQKENIVDYKIIKFFIKSTPGRIIFTKNLKSIKL